MTQGDIEERTGLLRSYVSRVENGRTVPSLKTLERFAGVLDVPLYQLFLFGKEAPPTPSRTRRKTLVAMTSDDGAKGTDAQFLLKLSNLLARLPEPDREVILSLAKRLATHWAKPSATRDSSWQREGVPVAERGILSSLPSHPQGLLRNQEHVFVSGFIPWSTLNHSAWSRGANRIGAASVGGMIPVRVISPRTVL